MAPILAYPMPVTDPQGKHGAPEPVKHTSYLVSLILPGVTRFRDLQDLLHL
ncbi:MAG TPA: hypothetical protein VKR61_24660 [Bryobacteraceae bacterium]|nr:hypothetical protein [Bryobacteraceae bacterium]